MIVIQEPQVSSVFHKSKEFFICGSLSGGLMQIFTKDNSIKYLEYGHSKAVTSMCFDPETDNLITTSFDNHVNIYDSNFCIIKTKHFNECGFTTVFATNDKIVVSAMFGAKNKLLVLDKELNELIRIKFHSVKQLHFINDNYLTISEDFSITRFNKENKITDINTELKEVGKITNVVSSLELNDKIRLLKIRNNLLTVKDILL